MKTNLLFLCLTLFISLYYSKNYIIMLKICQHVTVNTEVAMAAVQLQALRGRKVYRKPFWLGVAKSKRFIVHEQPILPPEERAELRRLHANYYSAMKSIRQYFIEKAQEQNVNTQVSDASTAEEIEASLRRNDEWNQQCANARAERLAHEDRVHEEHAMKVIDGKEESKRKLMERVEDLVRLEKENSKHFVTRENLDEKIEECLNSHTDYNFAIDLKGNVYTGFQTDMKQVSTLDSQLSGHSQQESRSVPSLLDIQNTKPSIQP